MEHKSRNWEIGGPKGKEPTGLGIGRRMGGFQIFNFKMLFMKLYIQWFMFKGGKLKFKGSSSSSNKGIKVFLMYLFYLLFDLYSTNSHKQYCKEKKRMFSFYQREITSLPDEGWTKTTDPEDFLGPIIFHNSGDSALLLKVGEENGNLTLETCEGDEQSRQQMF